MARHKAIMRYEPSYLNLYEQGHLKQLATDLEERAFSCSLCPHDCGVDRSRVKNGRCRNGLLPVISSWSPHFGEEAPLVGRRGSAGFDIYVNKYRKRQQR